MGKLVRLEFTGNWLLFWFLYATVLGIPLAVLYFFQCSAIAIETMENPSEFLERWKKKE